MRKSKWSLICPWWLLMKNSFFSRYDFILLLLAQPKQARRKGSMNGAARERMKVWGRMNGGTMI